MRDRPHTPAASTRTITWPVEWLPLVLLVSAAAHFVLMWNAASGTPVFSVDIYLYQYSNMLAALDALGGGGRGLLWNPYRQCGQPFFGIIHVALLSPTNVFYLFLSTEAALRAAVAFNVAVAGVGAYLLCRELGTSVVAGFCGALAFELANATVNVAVWTPMHSGTYVWMPVAMFFCERILRTPTLRGGLGLALAFSIAMVSGFPQTVLFMYQLVALRIAWEFATRRVAQPSQTLRALALGLLAPPLLTAVQLLPALETAQLSLRTVDAALDGNEVGTSLDWVNLRKLVALRRELANPFVLVPFMLACASLTHPRLRRAAAFYASAAVLYFVLSFGPGTPLYSLYALLPLGSQFRMPVRLLWVTGFCLSVLAGLGAQAVLAKRCGTTRVVWSRGSPLVAAVAGLAVYGFLARGLSIPEWGLAIVAVAGVVTATLRPGARRWAGLAIAVALAVNLLWFPLPVLKQWGVKWTTRPLPFARLLSSDDALHTHAPMLTELRARMSPQDRTYSVYRVNQLAFGPRTAPLLSVPSVQDYEPLTSLRFARYSVLMRLGRPMLSITQFRQLGSMLPPGFQKRLLDLAAARYLIVDPRAAVTGTGLGPPVQLLIDSPELRVYENPTALPRARYVPRIEVMPDAEALLQRLAHGKDDLSQLALVEAPLPSGFTGVTEPTAPASVEFVVNDPERILLRVEAPARGFLVLADQYFPGWTATVNGIPTPIVRANYVFRLVEVPAGTSTVEFRYAPMSLRIGAVISALSVLGAGVLFVWARGSASR